MKSIKKENEFQGTDFSKFTSEELVDTFVFPANRKLADEHKEDEDEFWATRRQQFENRTPAQRMYANIV